VQQGKTLGLPSVQKSDAEEICEPDCCPWLGLLRVSRLFHARHRLWKIFAASAFDAHEAVVAALDDARAVLDDAMSC